MIRPPAGLSRRHLLGGLCGCGLLGALAGCTTTGGTGGRIAPGYRPAQASDEAGLWQAMDKAEADVKRSRFTVRDDALTAYLHDMVCRLGADHCRDLRVYVVRAPVFNASMAPNGMMQVYTGLLLRARNEAQLAAIIGHEIGHYLQQHSLQRWRELRTQTDIAAFLGMGLGIAGGGIAASLPTLIALANVMAYSRENEHEADAIGTELMARAGYAPMEAPRIWEQLIAEEAAGRKKSERERELFFASHPAPEERLATLRTQAASLAAPGQADGATTYRARIAGLRTMLLQDELRLRQYGRTLTVLDGLAADGPPDGELLFFRGEVHRLRGADGDPAKAQDDLAAAAAAPGAPAEAWRSLGLVHRQAGRTAEADAAFRRYLELLPGAGDRDLVRSYIVGEG